MHLRLVKKDRPAWFGLGSGLLILIGDASVRGKGQQGGLWRAKPVLGQVGLGPRRFWAMEYLPRKGYCPEWVLPKRRSAQFGRKRGSDLA